MKKSIGAITVGIFMGSLSANATIDPSVCLASAPIRTEVIIAAVVLTLLGGLGGIAGMFK